VGGIVIDDQMEREPGRELVVNRLKELAELYRPMVAMKLPARRAGLEAECGEQVGALDFVIHARCLLRWHHCRGKN
jgi:hypothetical protein